VLVVLLTHVVAGGTVVVGHGGAVSIVHPVGRVVAIAGMPVRISAGDERRRATLDQLLGRCVPTELAPVIEISWTADPVPAPRVPVQQPDEDHGDVVVWFGDDAVVTRHTSGLVAVGTSAGVVIGGPLPATEPDRAVRRTMQHPLVEAAARHGRHTFHGAVLVRAGQAVLAVGGTGAGKSTLAYAAQRGGWDVLTDDVAMVSHDPGSPTGIVAGGLSKPLNVPADVLGVLPPGARALVDDDRRRWVVDLGVPATGGQVPVAGVLVLGHGSGSGNLAEHPGGADSLAFLVDALTMAGSPSRLRAAFGVATRLASRPVFVLTHHAEPAERIASATALLEELAAWLGLAPPAAVADRADGAQ
jgi:hypothetical protein